MSFAQELRSQTAAVRLRRSRLGVRRALTQQQVAQAAQVFHADGESVSASKRLLNTKHDAWRKVAGLLSQAAHYWETQTVAYPEPGIRLIRRNKIPEFDARMLAFRQELTAAVHQLQAVYGDLREAARANLGQLWNSSDYPPTLLGLFELAWEYPSIEPPAYLKELNPALYEQEQQRIAARFEEAVRLTEEALTAELSGLVASLCDQLTGTADGKPKVVRKGQVENLKAFFERFKEMGIRSNEQLEQLAKKAADLVDGLDAADIRKDLNIRENLAAKMAEVRDAVAGMVTVKKREIVLEDEAGAAV